MAIRGLEFILLIKTRLCLAALLVMMKLILAVIEISYSITSRLEKRSLTLQRASKLKLSMMLLSKSGMLSVRNLLTKFKNLMLNN